MQKLCPSFPFFFEDHFNILSLSFSVSIGEDSEGTLNGDTPKSPPGRPQRKEKKEFPVSVND